MKLIKILFIFSALSVMAQDLKQMHYFVDREMFAKGKNVVKELMPKSPGNADYYFYLGDIDFKNDKPDSARYWFMEGLKKNEKCALCYVGMGKVAMEANPTEGKANFDKAISLTPKDAKVYSAIGDYWLSLSKPEGKKGVEVLTKATELDPKNNEYRLMLGDAYRYAFDGSKAMALYKEVLAVDSISPQVYWRIGRLYLGTKNFELGKEYFNKGLEKDAQFSPIYRELGELYYKLRKYEKAIENYKKYVELRDKSDDTVYRFASFLFQSKNYKESLSMLSILDKKGYKNPILYRLLAYGSYETKDYLSAAKNMEIFWQKIKGNEIIASDYDYQGKIDLRNGKDSTALASIAKAIELDSAKKESYRDVAEYYNEKGKGELAVKYYSLFIPTGKASYNDYYQFGKICYSNSYFTKADSAFSKVIEFRPELHQGYFWRARASANLDPNSEKGLAKPYYEKYIEIASKDSQKNKDGLIEAYTYLGSYYGDQKDKVKAQESWNNVKTIDPTNAVANEALKKLNSSK